MISKMLKKQGWIFQPKFDMWNRVDDAELYTEGEALNLEREKAQRRREAAIEMLDDVADRIGGDL